MIFPKKIISNGQVTSKEYDRQYLNLILNKVIENKDIIIMKNIFGSEELKSNIDVNIEDTKGKYPIIKTLYLESKELYEYLLKQGANVDTKDKNGNSLLSLTLKDNLSIFSYLLRRGEIDIKC
ncbi:hypothetical protein LY90DRAFT_505137 [Neocallimastix californiae]|uniref:Uncharacterized protein n=1 Tax=Neocallimastix californiae TaxID=1754190 RepID=A0A1Y2DZ95_9FUNG|nr:hypothetical protein LY90DRAFT_505137 [Neocallimastix californiae]|eukprot:ORY64591.1 hypothetical protein LY90DRAFT_505137 [Neocallimastix californiae]